MPHFHETLRKLALRDDRFVDAVLGDEHENMEASGLHPRIYVLVQLGALIALDAASASYQSLVDDALAAGVSADEIAGALVALLPVTGVPRVTSAAPKLGLALGYDVDAALEGLDWEER